MDNYLLMQSVAVPLMIGYAIMIVHLLARKKSKKNIPLIPVRDFLVAVVAIDISIILPSLLDVQSLGTKSMEITAIYLALFFVHYALLTFAVKRQAKEIEFQNATDVDFKNIEDEVEHQQNYEKTQYKNIVDAYIVTMSLVTNAATLEAIFVSFGGL